MAEPFRLGGPLAPTSSNLSAGSSYSREALSKLVEQMYLGRLFQYLTTPLAMSFHFLPTEVCFAATHDDFLSVGQVKAALSSLQPVFRWEDCNEISLCHC